MTGEREIARIRERQRERDLRKAAGHDVPKSGTLEQMAYCRRCGAWGDSTEACRPSRKGSHRRAGAHYETVPHDHCQEPKWCDCECPGCMTAWFEKFRPGSRRRA